MSKIAFKLLNVCNKTRVASYSITHRNICLHMCTCFVSKIVQSTVNVLKMKSRHVLSSLRDLKCGHFSNDSVSKAMQTFDTNGLSPP